MPYDKFEPIQTFLIVNRCSPSECSVTKSAQSVRIGVYTAEKMLQEEAVAVALQRLADLSPVAFFEI